MRQVFTMLGRISMMQGYQSECGEKLGVTVPWL
jgi:hypothetical protein